MGSISLRKNYLSYSKLPLDIDSIIVTSGATAALWAAIRMSTQREKKEVIIFEMDLETNLIRIIDEIKNRK